MGLRFFCPRVLATSSVFSGATFLAGSSVLFFSSFSAASCVPQYPIFGEAKLAAGGEFSLELATTELHDFSESCGVLCGHGQRPAFRSVYGDKDMGLRRARVFKMDVNFHTTLPFGEREFLTEMRKPTDNRGAVGTHEHLCSALYDD